MFTNVEITNLNVHDQPFHTVMCLSIGTPKNNNFSTSSKWKITHIGNYFLSVPKFGQTAA